MSSMSVSSLTIVVRGIYSISSSNGNHFIRSNSNEAGKLLLHMPQTRSLVVIPTTAATFGLNPSTTLSLSTSSPSTSSLSCSSRSIVSLAVPLSTTSTTRTASTASKTYATSQNMFSSSSIGSKYKKKRSSMSAQRNDNNSHSNIDVDYYTRMTESPKGKDKKTANNASLRSESKGSFSRNTNRTRSSPTNKYTSSNKNYNPYTSKDQSHKQDSDRPNRSRFQDDHSSNRKRFNPAGTKNDSYDRDDRRGQINTSSSSTLRRYNSRDNKNQSDTIGEKNISSSYKGRQMNSPTHKRNPNNDSSRSSGSILEHQLQGSPPTANISSNRIRRDDNITTTTTTIARKNRLDGFRDAKVNATQIILRNIKRKDVKAGKRYSNRQPNNQNSRWVETGNENYETVTTPKEAIARASDHRGPKQTLDQKTSTNRATTRSVIPSPNHTFRTPNVQRDDSGTLQRGRESVPNGTSNGSTAERNRGRSRTPREHDHEEGRRRDIGNHQRTRSSQSYHPTSSVAALTPPMKRKESYDKHARKDQQNWSSDSPTPSSTKKEAVSASRQPSTFPPALPLSIFVTCHPGLESVLSQECTDLGIHHVKQRGGVQLTSSSDRNSANPNSVSVDDVLKCHLYLGSATNVLIRCGPPFTARAFGELERKVQALPWSNIISIAPRSTGKEPGIHGNHQTKNQNDIPVAPTFKVKVSSANSRLIHSTAIRERVLNGLYASLGLPVPISADKNQTDDEDERSITDDDNTRNDHLEENHKLDDVDDADDADDISSDDYPEIKHDEKFENSESVVLPLTVHVFRDKVQISLDTSSTPIHQRNYRFATCKAPLREDLAYGFLYSAGWKPKYYFQPNVNTKNSSTNDKKTKHNKNNNSDDDDDYVDDSIKNNNNKNNSIPEESNVSTGQTLAGNDYRSMIDPFCGSGTIPIEAAAMAYGLPPGRLRSAPLQGTVLYDKKRWKQMINKALQQSSQARTRFPQVQINASDRDAGAIKALQSNATRAGVLPFINVQECCSFTSNPWLTMSTYPNGTTPTNNSLPPGPCLLASNMPFGRRIQSSRKQSVNPTTDRVSNKDKQLNSSLLPMYQKLHHIIEKINAAGASSTTSTNKANQIKQNIDNIKIREENPIKEHSNNADNVTTSSSYSIADAKTTSTSTFMDAIILTNDPELVYRSFGHDATKTVFSTNHGGINVFGMMTKRQNEEEDKI